MFHRKGSRINNEDISTFSAGDGSCHFPFAAEEWATQLSEDELLMKKEDEAILETDAGRIVKDKTYDQNAHLGAKESVIEETNGPDMDSMYWWHNQKQYFLQKNGMDRHKLDLEHLISKEEIHRNKIGSKNDLRAPVEAAEVSINPTNPGDGNLASITAAEAELPIEAYEEDEGVWEYEYAEEDSVAEEEAEVIDEEEPEENEEAEINYTNEPSESSLASDNESGENSANADIESGTNIEDAVLRPYTLDEIESLVEIRHTTEKGRCLFAKHDFPPGSIVLVELPVLVAIPSLNYDLWYRLVEIHDAEELQLPPIWHLAAICSLTMLDETKKNICLDKWVPEEDTSVANDVKRVLSDLQLDFPPHIYGRMLKAWRYNSFGHHTEKDGLVLYNRISMMAHSCLSTACWHFGADDAFILRARVNLAADEELTISYIGDEDLFKSTDVRREKLSGWLFCCACKLCEAPVDVARGFRCSTCLIGTVFLKMEPSDEIYPSACTVCQSYPSSDTISDYISYESESVQQVMAIDTSDIQYAETCLDKIKEMFSQHWLLFTLHTILFEGNRDAENWDRAVDHQKERISFVTKVMPLSSYTLAWLFEEMGDLIANKIDVDLENLGPDYMPPISRHHKMFICHNYENAAALLQIICGENHEYRRAALEKGQRVMSLPTL
ncbi:apical complex lysine methyltransferase [Cardiosporidium cionae]|uniref:Apical complex lysine methyltransferase n=1 Tax=Cardiosporidium cionae TaxID=476202 RepID=A0ABQ7J9H2_9APIC|nr:apical complex lysine methyltransferase [Cardiosporidium cionae]|eukprot:KAF8820658.1 apical complex lysine methyltransferase [Cardiosporidium cionae]